MENLKSKKPQWFKQYDWYSKIKTETKQGYLSRTGIDVLSYIVSECEKRNKAHTATPRNKAHQDETFHFTCSCKEITQALRISQKTLWRCVNILEPLNLIRSYRSTQTTKWYVNHKALNALYAEITTQPTQPATEKEMCRQEAIEHATELQSKIEDIADINMFEATSDTIDNIIATSNETATLSTVEQTNLYQYEVDEHSDKIKEIKDNADTMIQQIEQVKENVLTPNQFIGLSKKYDLPEWVSVAMQHNWNVHFEKLNDANYAAILYIINPKNPKDYRCWARISRKMKSSDYL